MPANGNGSRTKAPISLHPAFPSIVALWFAALLGLGSMVIPVVLLESIVTATGLAAIIPGAEPPLGFTARGLIALLAAVTGAAAGLFLARKVAAGHAPAKPVRRFGQKDAAAPRPIQALEELPEEGLQPGTPRRRALSVTDEAAPSDFFSYAPLPGDADPDVLSESVVALDLDMVERAGPLPPAPETGRPATIASAAPFGDPFAENPAQADEANDAFELLELAEDDAFEIAPLSALPDEAGISPFATLHTAHATESQMDDKQQFQPLSPAAQRDIAVQQFVPVAEASPAPVDGEPLAEDEGTAAPLRDDLADLGLMQLAQRLGSTLARRRQLAAEAPAAPAAAPALLPLATAPVVPGEVEAARPEEAAQAMAAYFGKPAAISTPRDTTPAFGPAAIPSGLHSFLSGFEDEDGDEHEDHAKSFALPSAFAAVEGHEEPDTAAPELDELAESGADDESDGEADEDVGESGYSSLLALNNPFTAPRENVFVRIDKPEPEAPPASGKVVFPGQAADEAGPQRLFDRPDGGTPAPRPASADMNDALRNALSKLQKMSGAA